MTAKAHIAPPQGKPTRTGQGRVARASKGPRGYGEMHDVQLNLDPRIDLTQPIYEQVVALEKADKDAAAAE